MILGKLTSLLPRKECTSATWKHLRGLELADTDFCQPARIDCILGADVYQSIILPGLRKGAAQQPVTENTSLGWIITGGTSSQPSLRPSARLSFFISAAKLHDFLSRFWKIEEVQQTIPRLFQEEEACEEHFVRSHTRDSAGRYALRWPFSKTPSLPRSQAIATFRLLQTERRLQSKLELRSAYVRFMEEIIHLHHMELVTIDERLTPNTYYMPHHVVLRHDGSGKIRVVFNASQSTRSGLSLNDCLYTGPKLQTDISAILTRWRFFSVIFTTDIVKMFRQFNMHADVDWLRILWRNNPSEELQHCRLTTVVYGTACAPYQAKGSKGARATRLRG